jgi:AraC-like DNA-binding protein
VFQASTAIAVPYVRLIAEQLRRMGVSLPHWLELSGFGPGDLAREDFVVDLASFRSLALDARRLSREPALGLLLGEAMGVQAHGALGHAAMSSQSVREVLALIERYLGLRIALVGLRVDEGVDEARLVLTELMPLGEVRTMALEGVIGSIRSLLSDVSMGVCEVQSAHFPFEDPGYAPLAETLLRSPVRYQQGWAGLSLSPRTLDLPLKTSDSRAFRLADELCGRELLRIQERQSWEARVRRVLLETRVGFPTLEETARRLRVTPRTLHRRLVSEETSFRSILEDLRQGSAIEQLSSGEASIEEVAYILGYADPANFRRAFRRWTGVPPGRFRSQRAMAGSD